MSPEMSHRTFISYSRKDKDFALELAKNLRAAGFDIWLDLLDIPTGARWDDEVEAALKDCGAFLVIITPASSASDNVKDEIGYAIDNGKSILPILIENAEIPLRLRRFQYVDFTTLDREEGFTAAKSLLSKLVPEPVTPLEQPSVETRPPRSATPPATQPVRTNTKGSINKTWLIVGIPVVIVCILGVCLASIYASQFLPLPWSAKDTPTPKFTEFVIIASTPTDEGIPQPSETEISLPSNTPVPTQVPSNTPRPTSTPISQQPTSTDISPTRTNTPKPLVLPTSITVDGIPMALVPAGPFQRGTRESVARSECQKLFSGNCDAFFLSDEEPVRDLTLDDYYIDKYEVTNQNYAACVAIGACSEPWSKSSHTRVNYYGNTRYDDYPVINVTWENAGAYCRWRGGRLPTEAEWEKAARGTDNRLYPWGDKFTNGLANFCDENCDRSWANYNFDDGYQDTAPVGNYPAGASPYQIFDMAGNVSEWVADKYGPYQGGVADTESDHYGRTYVRRGGSWYSLGSDLRVSRRDDDLPEPEPDKLTNVSSEYGKIGFRCVLEVDSLDFSP